VELSLIWGSHWLGNSFSCNWAACGSDCFSSRMSDLIWRRCMSSRKPSTSHDWKTITCIKLLKSHRHAHQIHKNGTTDLRMGNTM
jgi:hypothetical protein